MALDGNSLAYRAFFALPEDMTNASGQTTNAVYGFTTMLVNLIKEHKPDGVVVVFDRPEPTFRHQAIPEYKAQREKAPETLRSQLGVIRELLDVFGITWLEMAGFEGDDLIATMADRAEREGRDILIVTGDRDSYQLVHDPHVRVLYNKRGVSDYAIYDEAGILERTGVTPAQYPDYAALRGDPSDNLDGIPGVGEKTAAKLVTQYGNLAAVLAAADEQTPKLKANLHEHGERVTRNASMMVLRRDVPIDVDLGSLAPAPDMAAMRRLFEFLEFKTMAKRVDDLVKDRGWAVRGDAEPPPTGSPSTESTPVEITFGATRTLDAAGAAQVITSLPELVVAARWEGDPGRSPLAGISVVVDAETGETGWIPSDVITDAKVGGAVASHRAVVAHDAKPIMRSLLSAGIDMQGL
ncbi:MAG: DNA polymerase I, partial [Actinobacteria bacterium]|nr:DNA polymerase I [Actinomycetota bacterium]